MVNIFQPEVICIGGGVSNAGEKILKPIRKNIKCYSFARFGKKQTEVQIAKLSNDAGIIGQHCFGRINNSGIKSEDFSVFLTDFCITICSCIFASYFISKECKLAKCRYATVNCDKNRNLITKEERGCI